MRANLLLTMSRSTREAAASRNFRRRILAVAVTAVAVAFIAQAAIGPKAEAATTGNGALVYSPAAGTSFNPEGGRAAGTTYAKNIVLKNIGSSNGTQLVTYPQTTPNSLSVTDVLRQNHH